MESRKNLRKKPAGNAHHVMGVDNIEDFNKLSLALINTTHDFLSRHLPLRRIALEEYKMEGVQTRNGLYGFEFRDTDKRRKTKDLRKTYDVKSLWQRNHEIVNMAARGFKQVEIAEILNIHPQTVSNTLNSELGERKLSDIRLERDNEAKVTSEKIRTITNKALKVYNEIFDDTSGQVGLKDKGNFAEGFLKEMSGLRAPTQVHSVNTSYTLTPEELRAFNKRGIEAAKGAGIIIDIKPEQIEEKTDDSMDQTGGNGGSAPDSEERPREGS